MGNNKIDIKLKREKEEKKPIKPSDSQYNCSSPAD